jgi:hypothetical protein
MRVLIGSRNTILLIFYYWWFIINYKICYENIKIGNFDNSELKCVK